MTGAQQEESLERLRQHVQSFLQTWRQDHEFTPKLDAWLRGYDRGFSRALGSQGWIGLTWPTQVGGSGRSHLARVVLTEELLRAGAPVAAHWIADRQIGPGLLRFGSEVLQQEFMPRIAAGEVTFCLGMSETEAGSDLAAVRTRAVRVGGGWLLSGAKTWSSHADKSDYAYVLARTSIEGSKHVGLSELIVDMAADGVKTEPIEDMLGESHFCNIVFDDVFVPDRRIIGAVGEGWRQVTETLSFERGGAERVLSTYLLFEAFARRVTASCRSDHRQVLGELGGRALALRQMVWRVAQSMDSGTAPVREAAILKHLGTTFERDVVDCARSMLPSLSGADFFRLEELVDEGTMASPAFTIRGGTTEVLLSIIGRSELKP